MGEEINSLARIVEVSDVFDALISYRCYKKAWEPERVRQLFREARGNQFAPRVVDALFQIWDEMMQVKEQYADDVSDA